MKNGQTKSPSCCEGLFIVAFSDNKPPAMQVELKIFRYKNVLLWYTVYI